MAKVFTLVDRSDRPIYEAHTTPTFSATAGPITPAATATDVFIINGAANKLVKVYRMTVVTIQTTAGVNSWSMVKRSTANTGGTAVAATVAPHDSLDAAATAVVQHYTANPTPGTSVGTVWLGRVASPSNTAVGFNQLGVEVNFSELFGKPMHLRGVAEGLAWNFNGVAIPAGMTVIAGVQFTEEDI
jgi:hypothetical protein